MSELVFTIIFGLALFFAALIGLVAYLAYEVLFHRT